MRIFQNRKKKQPNEAPIPALTYAERKVFEIPQSGGRQPYSVYDQMEQDSMIQTVLNTKKLAVLAAPYRLETSETEDGLRRREFIEKVFEEMEGSPKTILMQAMDAFAKGWSVQELVFEPRGEGVILKAVRPKNPARFGLELDEYGVPSQLHLHLPGEPVQELDRSRFVVYRHRHQYARSKGTSDLDSVVPHWRAKQSLLAAWKIHLERYASPTVLGRYARGLPREEQESIASVLSQLSQKTSIVFPSELEVSLLGGDRGASTGFQEAIDYHNREIARAILGNTLTVDEGRRIGSMTLGRVHLQVMMMQMDVLREDLAREVMTEQVIRPLIEMNFGGGEVPRFMFSRSKLSLFGEEVDG
ncbi:MAG TPA: DUF935 family protein [Fimbriimonadaceae bacterium]|nr:DUF935 family protein [Fimbriimonadaceae bacterium]HRJ32679.1 DUF935 family protein [Fimbriimonadaceae bacterium]